MPPSTAILFVQTGTPEDASREAVRSFLAEFFADPFVIQSPWTRWTLQHLFLPFYLRKAVRKYERFFGRFGRTLINHTTSLAENWQKKLPDILVVYAMRYGEPSLRKTLEQLIERNFSKVIVVPLFPQYSYTTVGSIEDIVTRTWREHGTDTMIEIIKNFYSAPGFIDSLAAHINSKLSKDTEQLFLSYHSLPVAHARNGDPYINQCLETTNLLKERIHSPPEKISHVYQSKMGLGKWQGPFLKNELKRIYQQGLRNVTVAFPGFMSDCQETLGEVGELVAYWQKKGMRVQLIPCLNDQPSFPIHSTGHSPIA